MSIENQLDLTNPRTYDSFGNLTAESAATVDLAFAYTGEESKERIKGVRPQLTVERIKGVRPQLTVVRVGFCIFRSDI